MKPPQFTECSVCGREFGSKSIVIHEPQCLQRLRRTEIAQQEQESSSSSNNKKNSRKKKKSSDRKEFQSTTTSPLSSTSSSSPLIPYSPPRSFVLLTTTTPKNNSSNYLTSMEKFNLPRIPINTFPSSAHNSNRPSTAILDKPRILNPDYIQYDMSLTRIDFTGLPLKDENLNSPRPQTQTMESHSGGHAFTLPTVVDVIPKPPERITKLTEACSSLLPSANITTTIHSSLGDLQKRTQANPGTSRPPPFHNATTLLEQSQQHQDLSGYPPEISSSSSRTPLPLTSSTPASPPPTSSRTSLSPPLESLYPSPQAPFYFKLSTCELAKPLRTLFQHEKMSARRESHPTHLDNFLTPRPSSNCTPAGAATERTSSRPHSSPTPTPLQPADNQDGLFNDSSETELHLHSRTFPRHQDEEPDPPERQITKHFQQFTQDLQRHYKGITEDSELKQEKLWSAPEYYGQACFTPPEIDSVFTKTKDSLNWIGEPFMKPFTYYKTPLVKEDTNGDSESESYATPAGESQDELLLDKEPGSESENNQQSLTNPPKCNTSPPQPHLPFKAWLSQDGSGCERRTDDDDIKLLNIDQPLHQPPASRTSSSISEIIFDASSYHETVKLLHNKSSTSCSEFSDTFSASPPSLLSNKRASSLSQPDKQEYSSDTTSKGDNADSSKTKTVYSSLRRGRHKESKMMRPRESGSDADDEDQDSNFSRHSYSSRKRSQQTFDHLLGRRISTTTSLNFPSRKLRDLINPPKPQLSSHILQEMYQDLLKKNQIHNSTQSHSDSLHFNPNQALTHPHILGSFKPSPLISPLAIESPKPLHAPFNFSSPSQGKLIQAGAIELPQLFSTTPNHQPIPQQSQSSFEKVPNIASETKTSETSLNKSPHFHLPYMPSPSSDQSSLNFHLIQSLQNSLNPVNSSYQALPHVNHWLSEKTSSKHAIPSSDSSNISIHFKNPPIHLPLAFKNSDMADPDHHVPPLKDETLLVDIDPTKFELVPPTQSTDPSNRPHTSLPESQQPLTFNKTFSSTPDRPLTSTTPTPVSLYQKLSQLHQQTNMANFPGLPTKKSARARPRTLQLPENLLPHFITQRPASSPASIPPDHHPPFRPSSPKFPKQSSRSARINPPSQLAPLTKPSLEKQIQLRQSEALAKALSGNAHNQNSLSSPYWKPLVSSVPVPQPKYYSQRYPKWFSLHPPGKGSGSLIPTRVPTSRTLPSVHPLPKKFSRPHSQPQPSSKPNPAQSLNLREANSRGKRVHFSSPPRHSREYLTPPKVDANANPSSDSDSSRQSEPEAKKTRLRVQVQGFDKNKGKLRVTIKAPAESANESGNNEIFTIRGQDASSSPTSSPPEEQEERTGKGPVKACAPPSSQLVKSSHAPFPKEQVVNALEKLELLRDKVRNKEFERRKRGRDGDAKRLFSSISMLLPPLTDDDKDDVIDLKIIVRRKNKDGTLPPIENVLNNFSTKWTYLIIDEQPLTRNSPNSYLSAHNTKPTAQKPEPARPLKITTSNQSSINSLSESDAATRFLTCYICGQTFNVRNYMDHEEECRADVAQRNKHLHENEKRILPEKPRGTITIQRWNEFAAASLKSRFVSCPYCGMEFVPDNLEDFNLHVKTCLNAPPPEITSSVTVGELNLPITVETANDAAGWVVPTLEELRKFGWNTREGGRFQSYMKQSIKYAHNKRFSTRKVKKTSNVQTY